jgi:PRTRC genetic system protein B
MNVMNLAQLNPMSTDETAALLFVCGDQYLFRHRAKNGAFVYKFISPAAVRAAFAEETIDTDWLPSQARRWGIGKRGEWMAVAFPPQRHRFLFAQEGGEEKSADANEFRPVEIPMPALAFFGYGQRYYLWAFKDAELRGDTVLFAAPLPNIDANGAICFGSNVVPKASAQTIEEAWRIFLASPFTNHSVNGKSRKFPADVRKPLIRLTVQRRRRYPIEDLVSLNRTANLMIDWTLRGIE